MLKVEMVKEEIVNNCGYGEVTFSMTDQHAHYFMAKQNGNEFEVKAVHETGEVAFHNVGDGAEDWITEHYIQDELCVDDPDTEPGWDF